MLSFDVTTTDGPMRTSLHTPAGTGPWPAVILVTDAGGPRPAFDAMAQRLADHGFAVAVPDLFHRVGTPFALLPDGGPSRDGRPLFAALRSDPAIRTALLERYVPSAANPDHVKRDLGALLTALTTRPEVKAGPVGLSGYCMGGGICLRAAALFPERVAAVASFHGGHLATTAPDSPHLGLPSVKAEVLVAGAEEDPSFSPELQERLVAALRHAGLRHHVEVWAGSRHGFSVSDSPVFRAEFGARHDAELLALMQRALS